MDSDTTSESPANYSVYDDGILSVRLINYEKRPDEMLYFYSLELFNRSRLYQLREITFSAVVMNSGTIGEQKIVQWLKRRGKKYLLLSAVGGGEKMKFASITYKKHSSLIDFLKWSGDYLKYISKLFD
ncbi:MAG: hypothetical protein JW878_01515 [Methanomicrobia archaeon]|nr:hypothetical protein [Methanomicrobia archaeon]